MKKYLGVKVIQAEPMSLTEYNSKFNRVVPATKVEYGYLVEYEDGYASWSPKDVFEKAYREVSDLDFIKPIHVDTDGTWGFIQNDSYQGDCCVDDCTDMCESIN